MTGISKKLEKIASQADKWIWFSRISPVLLLMIASTVYGINYATSPVLLYISWCIFFFTCIVWWLWVIKAIHEMTELFAVVFQLVQRIQHDLNGVRKDLENSSEE